MSRATSIRRPALAGWILVTIGALYWIGPLARATDGLDLLREAIDQWSNERDAWAFTQRVREFDDAGSSRTRVERYDPSRGEAERWTLVSVDGRPPTEKEIARYLRRKGTKKKDREPKTPSEYVDFGRVVVLAKDDETVQFAVPLRKDISRLIPLEDLTVIMTVDRSRRAIRQLGITLEDPLKIAFGLARVTDMNIDLRFDFPDQGDAHPAEGVQPGGVAEASMSKFGDRAEFSWSEFERVEPAPPPPEGGPPPAPEKPGRTDRKR